MRVFSIHHRRLRVIWSHQENRLPSGQVRYQAAQAVLTPFFVIIRPASDSSSSLAIGRARNCTRSAA